MLHFIIPRNNANQPIFHENCRINFKSQSYQGRLLDDTGGAGIRLVCGEVTSTQKYEYEYRTYDSDDPGTWYDMNGAGKCGTNEWMVGFKTSIQTDSDSDDTGLVCIKILCSDGTQLESLGCEGMNIPLKMIDPSRTMRNTINRLG